MRANDIACAPEGGEKLACIRTNMCICSRGPRPLQPSPLSQCRDNARIAVRRSAHVSVYPRNQRANARRVSRSPFIFCRQHTRIRAWRPARAHSHGSRCRNRADAGWELRSRGAVRARRGLYSSGVRHRCSPVPSRRDRGRDCDDARSARGDRRAACPDCALRRLFAGASSRKFREAVSSLYRMHRGRPSSFAALRRRRRWTSHPAAEEGSWLFRKRRVPRP
jgi:hypothetical protein